MLSSHLVGSTDLNSIFGGHVSTDMGADTVFAQQTNIHLTRGDDNFVFNAPDDVNVYAGNGNDYVVREGVGHDAVYGGNGDDTIINYAGGSVIENGGAGNDVLVSHAGDAILNGGSGSNVLFAAGGNVTMIGNSAGTDWFVFGGGQNTFRDTIHGALYGQDHVDVSQLGYVDGGGNYHEVDPSQLSVHGNALWVTEQNGNVDVIDGIGNEISLHNGVYGAIADGFLILAEKG